jgi:hypothetical protein
MVDENRITADQGARLLEALCETEKSGQSTQLASTIDKAQYFRVLVTDSVTGRTKTSVTLPMRLVRWGLTVGSQYSPELGDVNLEELANILESTDGQIVEVIDEEDGEHVRIFIE